VLLDGAHGLRIIGDQRDDIKFRPHLGEQLAEFDPQNGLVLGDDGACPNTGTSMEAATPRGCMAEKRRVAL